MATDKQKAAARRNIEKAREVQSERARGEDIPRQSDGLSTAEKDRLPEAEFAFPAKRKEPLSDAAHVRNAIARFDQVEGVTDEERDQAWQRIRAAAGKYGVHVSEDDWRDLSSAGNDRRLPGFATRGYPSPGSGSSRRPEPGLPQARGFCGRSRPARSGRVAEISGHAISVTLSVAALATALGALAAIALTRTVLAARRESPPPR
jgi:hypothetical protein